MAILTLQKYLNSRARLLALASESDVPKPLGEFTLSSMQNPEEEWNKLKPEIAEFYGKFLNLSTLGLQINYEQGEGAVRNKNMWFTHLLNEFVKPKNMVKALRSIYEDILGNEEEPDTAKKAYQYSHKLYKFLEENVQELREYHGKWARETSSGRTGKFELTLDKRQFEGVLEDFTNRLLSLVRKLEKFSSKKLKSIEPIEREVALHDSYYYDKTLRERPDALIAIGLGDEEGKKVDEDIFNFFKSKILSSGFQEERHDINRYLNAIYRKGPSFITLDAARRAVAYVLGWFDPSDIAARTKGKGEYSPWGSPLEVGTKRLHVVHDDDSLKTLEEMRDRVKSLHAEEQIAKSMGQRKYDDLARDLKDRQDKLLDRMAELTTLSPPIESVTPSLPGKPKLDKYQLERQRRIEEMAEKRRRTHEAKKEKARLAAEQAAQAAAQEALRQNTLSYTDKNIEKFVEGSPIVYTTKEGKQYEGNVQSVSRDAEDNLSSIRFTYLDPETNNTKSKLLSGDSTSVRHKKPGESLVPMFEPAEEILDEKVTEEPSQLPPDVASSSYVLHSLASESSQIVSSFIKKFKKLQYNRG
jgi:hypothetical protein